MSVIAVTDTSASQEGPNDGVVTYTWASIKASDTCAASAAGPAFSDRSMQVTGNFSGSASIGLTGSNDGTNYAALRDPQGTTLAFTAAGLKQIQENVKYLKPTIASGDGSADVTVTILARRR